MSDSSTHIYIASMDCQEEASKLLAVGASLAAVGLSVEVLAAGLGSGKIGRLDADLMWREMRAASQELLCHTVTLDEFRVAFFNACRE